MALVDHTARAVTVEQIHSEEESLWQQLEGSMGFDEKIQEIRAHEPLNLGLNVNGVHIWKCLRLQAC
jgi:hypothetical protein